MSSASLPQASVLLPLKFEIGGENAWRESLHKCCTAIEAADFDRGGLSADLLSDFVLDLNLSVCDLHIIVNKLSLHMKGMTVL